MWQEQNMCAPRRPLYDDTAGYHHGPGFAPPPRPPFAPPFMSRPVRMQRDDSYQVDFDVPPFKRVKTGHGSSRSTDAHGRESGVS